MFTYCGTVYILLLYISWGCVYAQLQVAKKKPKLGTPACWIHVTLVINDVRGAAQVCLS